MGGKKYVSEHPIFSVTADLVVLTIRAGRLCVLLVRRGGEPFRGALALPGGFVEEDEDLVTAAHRELEEEAGVGPDDVELEQLATYGDPDRDPRGRVVTVAWVVLAAEVPEPTAGSDAAEAMWLPVDEVLDGRHGPLAFDHRVILSDGLERARAKIEYTGLAAAFCRREFTVGELRRVYEAVWGGGRELDPANFQRKVLGIEGFLKPTGNMRRDGRGRPSRTYTADRAARLMPPMTRP
ncbi:NUDIX domain-containing protein [Fodinibacter luteus]|uniref:NUDIX domain-containing protein n=1 Tax=Fodinibacter luteus TaxID=552064 RepID=A0ABP8KAH0_9MICO